MFISYTLRPLASSTLFPYTTLFRSHLLAAPDRTPPHKWAPSIRAPEGVSRSEEHTSELQSRLQLVCRLLLEKKNDQRACAVPPSPTPYSTPRPPVLPPRRVSRNGSR